MSTPMCCSLGLHRWTFRMNSENSAQKWKECRDCHEQRDLVTNPSGSFT